MGKKQQSTCHAFLMKNLSAYNKALVSSIVHSFYSGLAYWSLTAPTRLYRIEEYEIRDRILTNRKKKWLVFSKFISKPRINPAQSRMPNGRIGKHNLYFFFALNINAYDNALPNVTFHENIFLILIFPFTFKTYISSSNFAKK